MTGYFNGPQNMCLVCRMPDSRKPMVFRGTDWCSDDHRKVITNEITPDMRPDLHAQMSEFVRERFMSNKTKAQVMIDLDYDLSDYADPNCTTCEGSGRVDWAPGQNRDSESDQQPCPDCMAVWA